MESTPQYQYFSNVPNENTGTPIILQDLDFTTYNLASLALHS